MTATIRVANGDVVLTPGGGHERVTKGPKLRQGLKAILSLPAPFCAGLMDVLAPNSEDAFAVSLDLRRTIRTVVEGYAATLRTTQRAERDPEEQIGSIEALTISVLEDPVSLSFRLAVKPASGDVVAVSGARVFP